MTRFLVDAHLPRRLCDILRDAGHDAIHTSELATGNRTTDVEINEVSVRDKRIVITKDADFVQSFVLQGRPYRLLLVSTGNIRNQDLLALFEKRLDAIVELFENTFFVELSREYLIVHSLAEGR